MRSNFPSLLQIWPAQDSLYCGLPTFDFRGSPPSSQDQKLNLFILRHYQVATVLARLWSIFYFRFSIMNQTKSIFIKPSPHCEDDPNLNYLNIKYSRRLSRGRHSDWKIGLHYTFSTIPPSSHLRANQFKTFGKWPECWVLRTLLSRVFLLLLTRHSLGSQQTRENVISFQHKFKLYTERSRTWNEKRINNEMTDQVTPRRREGGRGWGGEWSGSPCPHLGLVINFASLPTSVCRHQDLNTGNKVCAGSSFQVMIVER